MKRQLLIGLLLVTSSCCAAANCLDDYAAKFTSHKLTLAYWSKTPNKYYVQDVAGNTNGQCVTTFAALTTYLQQHYAQAGIKNPGIKQGWNSLTLNGQVVYDGLSQLKPQQIASDYQDFASDPATKKSGYWVRNSLDYQAISVVNQEYACYSYALFTVVTGTAHPSTSLGLACVKAGSSTPLKLTDVVVESAVVKRLLADNYIKAKLTQAKIPLTGLKSLNQLSEAMAQTEDDELQCFASNLNQDASSFALTALNADQSVNLQLGLNSDIGACSNLFKVLNLANIPSKMPIKSVIAARDF